MHQEELRAYILQRKRGTRTISYPDPDHIYAGPKSRHRMSTGHLLELLVYLC